MSKLENEFEESKGEIGLALERTFTSQKIPDLCNIAWTLALAGT